MSANDRQVGGSHYKDREAEGVQHWDLAAMFRLDYFQGVISKYIFRWRDKAGIQDLEKAAHYLEKYIECEKNGYSLEQVQAIIKALDEMYLEPVPMIIHCPRCHTQHVDEPDLTKGWTNPPHRSHECQACDFTFRVADVPTVGVREIQTAGKRDNDPMEGWLNKHRSTPEFSLEGFKEGYALYRCQHPQCCEHFHVPVASTPYEQHRCPHRSTQHHDTPVGRVTDLSFMSPAERLGLEEPVELSSVTAATARRLAAQEDGDETLYATTLPRVACGYPAYARERAEAAALRDTDKRERFIAHCLGEPSPGYVDQAQDRVDVPKQVRGQERRLVDAIVEPQLRVGIRRLDDRVAFEKGR